jgi:Ca-activated chloride channel family protein
VRPLTPRSALFAVTATALVVWAPVADGQEGFRFRSGVDLVNVNATVTDRTGRFVAGLRQSDFTVYDDGVRQEITHFSNERVPVSLGIAIDTSGSMAGERMAAAREALDRLLLDLLQPEDEVFVIRFSATPQLVQPWTTDHRETSRRIGRISPAGGTALYDAVADAIPLVQTGQHRKKALLIISDGNDTSSRTSTRELTRLIRESEVLVYAIGIDGDTGTTVVRRPQQRPPIVRPPLPIPFPVPGRGQPRSPQPPWIPQPGTGGGAGGGGGSSDRVNVPALRGITDDSGGRTEIIYSSRDLDPATASIADELSRQYYLGYTSPGHRDNRWHTIDVEVSNPSYRVRARRGYVATP